MPMTRIHLRPEFFTPKEEPLVTLGRLSATAFLFPGGVAGLRMRNEVGELVMLPFQGQQIWSAKFYGRDLTMKSMFAQPRPTRVYLETYGGFLLHCGATAMGVPSPEDDHPLHGELPNAPFQSAELFVDENEKGVCLGLQGRYQHTVAFSHNYLAEPLVRLFAGSSMVEAGMRITNLMRVEMELMYMAHINFRPVDHGRLVYSAPGTPDHVRVRTSIPSHIRPRPGYRELIAELARRPQKHEVLTPDLVFDPEVVFSIDYLADEAGWAHSLQIHPDGGADYIRHRPDQLDQGIRWISRTPDQDALGLVLPATAEPEGYLAEKAKGHLKVIPPQGTWQCDLAFGALRPEETASLEAKIERILTG